MWCEDVSCDLGRCDVRMCGVTVVDVICLVFACLPGVQLLIQDSVVASLVMHVMSVEHFCPMGYKTDKLPQLLGCNPKTVVSVKNKHSWGAGKHSQLGFYLGQVESPRELSQTEKVRSDS